MLALGGNLPSAAGTPEQTLRRAVAALGEAGLAVVAASRLFRTPAFPAGSGPDFVNAAVQVETGLAPAALLDRLHMIEAAIGRTRHGRWQARAIDIDLLAMGETVLPDRATYLRWQQLDPERQQREAPAALILPHPRIQDRGFVLAPLADVAPGWRHPVLGRTVAEMLAALPEADRAAMVPLD